MASSESASESAGFGGMDRWAWGMDSGNRAGGGDAVAVGRRAVGGTVAAVRFRSQRAQASGAWK